MRTAAIIFFLLLCAQLSGLSLNASVGKQHYPASHLLSAKKQVTMEQSSNLLFWEEEEDEESWHRQASLFPYVLAFAQAFLQTKDNPDALAGITADHPFLFLHTPAYIFHGVLLI